MAIFGQIEETETNCNNEIKTFSIAASPIAFQVLSSRLYSEPILAIVRELLTNAYDSHIAANNTHKAIDIQIPTAYKHNFIIRDYGTGLSENDVMTMYTTFFSSTKNNSNDFTGCFGLGSKTPFAYTSGFTVISYFNGIKYTFAITTVNSLPSIVKINEENTDEKNGLEINIPVKSNEYYQFYDAFNTFMKFNEDIAVNGVVPLDKPKILFKNEFCTVYNQKLKNIELYVKQGQNIYPLNHETDSENIRVIQKILKNVTVVLNVPIGSIDITPSREEIQKTEKNLELIAEFAKKTCKCILETMESKTFRDGINSFNIIADSIVEANLNNDIDNILRNTKNSVTTFIPPYVQSSVNTYDNHITYSIINPSIPYDIGIYLYDKYHHQNKFVNLRNGSYIKLPTFKNIPIIWTTDFNEETQRKHKKIVKDKNISYIVISKGNNHSFMQFISILSKIAKIIHFLDNTITIKYLSEKSFFASLEIEEQIKSDKEYLFKERAIGAHLPEIRNKYKRKNLSYIFDETHKKDRIYVHEHEYVAIHNILHTLYNNIGTNNTLISSIITYLNKCIKTDTINENNFRSINICAVKKTNEYLIKKQIGVSFVNYNILIDIGRKHVKPIKYNFSYELSEKLDNIKCTLEKLTIKEKALIINCRNYRRIQLLNQLMINAYYESVAHIFYDNNEISHRHIYHMYEEYEKHKNTLKNLINMLNYIDVGWCDHKRVKKRTRLCFIHNILNYNTFDRRNNYE